MKLNPDNASTTGCVPCAEGEAGAVGSCEPCGAGRAPSVDRVACAVCAPGRASGNGISCATCVSKGHAPNRVAGATYCLRCPAGRYSSRVLSSGANTSVTYSAAVACLPCREGTVSDSGSAGPASCKPCRAGQQPSKLGSHCEACPAVPSLPRLGLCGAHSYRQMPIPSHTAAAVRALLELALATAGGKGAETRPKRSSQACAEGTYSPRGEACRVCGDRTREPNQRATACVCPTESYDGN